MLFLTYQPDHDTALLRTPPLWGTLSCAYKGPTSSTSVLSVSSSLPFLPARSPYSNHTGFFSVSHTHFLLFFQLKCKLLRARVRVCLSLPPGLGQCLAHASHTVNACGNTDLITKEPMFDEYRTMGLQILSLKIYFIPDKTFYKPYFVKHVF